MKSALLYFLKVIVFLFCNNIFAQLSISFPRTNMVFQRTNEGTAKIQISGNLTIPVEKLQVKFEGVRQGVGQTTEWQNLLIAVEAGHFTNSIVAPQGWYKLHIRGISGNDLVTNVVIIEPIGIGEVFLIVGHSNASGDNTTERGANEDRVVSPQFDTTFPTMNDYGQTADTARLPNRYAPICRDCSIAPFGGVAWFWGQLGDLLVQKFNVPVAFYSAAFGGSNMAMTYMAAYDIPFEHGFINYNLRMPYVNIRNTFKKYVPQTGLRAILSGHGINDAGYTTADIKFFYEKVIEKVRQETNKNDLAWLVAISGYNNGVQQHIVDAQQQVIANDPYVFEGGHLNDIGNDGRWDGLHFNVLGQQLAAQKWNEAISSEILQQISPIIPYTITNPIGSLPYAGEDKSLSCNGSQAPSQTNLSANPISGGVWTQIEGATANIVDIHNPTTEINNLVAGNYKFKWTAGSFSDEVIITVPANCCIKPQAGTDISLCRSNQDLLTHQLIATSNSQTWIKGNVPDQSNVEIDSHSGLVSNLDKAGTYVFILQENAGCSDTIQIILTNKPSVQVYDTSLPCDNSQVDVYSSVNPSGGNYNWSGAGIISSTHSAVATVNQTGNFTLEYSYNGCSSIATAIVSNSSPAKPTATSPIQYTQNQTALSLQANGTNLKWYDSATGGSPLHTPPIPSTQSVGTFYYYVSQTLNGCESERTQIAVIVSAIPSQNVCLSIKLFLQGTMVGDIMHNILYTKGLLPGQALNIPIGVATPNRQPYYIAPWNYSGNETVSDYSNVAVDWVLVSLRTHAEDASTMVFRGVGVLQADGQVNMISNCPTIDISKTYYIVVEHRNHIGAISHAPIGVNDNKLTYDFSIQDSYHSSNPGFGQIIVGNKYCLIVGDGNKGSFSEVNTNDYNIWRSSNGVIGKYLAGDYNLDGEVNASDIILWRKNNGKISSVSF